MVYTLRQFIYECDNYEYSQEYFDIMKESMEIDLMERYIKNQEFLIESGIDTSVYTEGYFMEADDKSVEDVKGKVNEKKESLFKRIIDWIVNKGKQFGKFCKGILDKIFKINNKNKDIGKKIINTLSNDKNTDNHENNNTNRDDGNNTSDGINTYEIEEIHRILVDLETYLKYHRHEKFDECLLRPSNEYYSNTEMYKLLSASVKRHNYSISSETILYLVMVVSPDKVIIDSSNLPSTANGSNIMTIKELLSMYKYIQMIMKINNGDRPFMLPTKRNTFCLIDYDSPLYDQLDTLIQTINDIQLELKLDVANSHNNTTITGLNDYIQALNLIYSNLSKLYTEYYDLENKYSSWYYLSIQNAMSEM